MDPLPQVFLAAFIWPHPCSMAICDFKGGCTIESFDLLIPVVEEGRTGLITAWSKYGLVKWLSQCNDKRQVSIKIKQNSRTG